MIHIRAWRNAQGEIWKMSFSGHAGAGIQGEDVVCAAVSVLAQTLLLGLDQYLPTDVQLLSHDEQKGELIYSWTPCPEQAALIQSVLHSLKLIAEQESSFVSFSEVS